MKRVELTKGIYSLIDGEDCNLVSQYKWYASRIGHKWYVITRPWDFETKKQYTLSMHRLIMNAQPNQQVDHKEHYNDYIDNQRSNLRLCTTTENNHNVRKRLKPTSSRYKGVSWDKNAEKWRSEIMVNRKYIYFGLFISEIQAARIYNMAAIKYFGEFAKLNTI